MNNGYLWLHRRGQANTCRSRPEKAFTQKHHRQRVQATVDPEESWAVTLEHAPASLGKRQSAPSHAHSELRACEEEPRRV